MSQQNNIRKVFLMALSEPEYARVDYWIAEGKKSIYRKETFINKLVDAHLHYEHMISKKEAEFKAINPAGTISNPGLPLVYETDHELTGHLRKEQLNELGKSLLELYKFWFPKKFNINTEDINNVQPIHWLKGVESLRLFINELIRAGLIEDRETEEVIQEHFKVDGQMPTKKSKPISWYDSLSLLAYLIESLDRKFINPDSLWRDTMPHFIKNNETPQNMKQTANRYKNNKSGKPQNYEIVDQIIKSLPFT